MAKAVKKHTIALELYFDTYITPALPLIASISLIFIPLLYLRDPSLRYVNPISVTPLISEFYSVDPQGCGEGHLTIKVHTSP